MTLDQASMQGIKAWAAANPRKLREALDSNPSYVFFREMPRQRDAAGPIGTLGVPLTAGYSIAVDPRSRAAGRAGVPRRPRCRCRSQPLERLVAAQDTGGAIRGAVRADFYWGSGSGGRRARRPHAPAGAACGSCGPRAKAPAEALQAYFSPPGAPIPSSFSRSWRGVRPPPARSPLAKNSVGVPLTRSERPSSGAPCRPGWRSSRLPTGTLGVSFGRELQPGLGAVGRAPHRRANGRRMSGPDHRIHEHVDGDVVDLQQRLLQAPAVGAVRVAEHRQHALAVAALNLDRQIERQRAELDRRELSAAAPRSGCGRISHVDEAAVDERKFACASV